jgi:isochorismate synthase
MSALFQKIKEQLNNQLPFVCYCKPNSDKIIALFQKNDALFDLDATISGFAFVSFDDEKRYLIPENQSDVYFETVAISDFNYPKNSDSVFEETSKINFETLVEKAVHEIEIGTFEKVVLSRKETIFLNDFDLELVFNQLLANYKTAFNYCFFHPKVGFWIGASPEQFLKIEDSILKTVALAGTQLNTKSQDYVWADKEINEQQIVTDFIVKNLVVFSDSIAVSKPYNYQAGSIIHIKTDIEAVLLHQSKLDEIVVTLHPTPAVCGFPKVKAKQFILDNEGYNREFYAGFLGEWNKDFLTYKKGNSDLFVNLRCMKIENIKAVLFVGCGINKGSNPTKEFMETVNKSQTMKKVL